MIILIKKLSLRVDVSRPAPASQSLTRQALKPSSSSLRFRFRPMNTILFTLGSSAPHSTDEGPKLMCS